MRINLPAIIQGSLGSLVQVVASGVNALAVRLLGGTYADDVTRAGVAFSKNMAIASSGGLYPHNQVRNPVGSGVIVYVDSIVGHSDDAYAGGGHMSVSLYNTAMATDAGFGVNMDSGGAAGKAKCLQDFTASTVDGTEIARQCTPAAANGVARFTFPSPIRLGEGEGVQVSLIVANKPLYNSIQYRELTV